MAALEYNVTTVKVIYAVKSSDVFATFSMSSVINEVMLVGNVKLSEASLSPTAIDVSEFAVVGSDNDESAGLLYTSTSTSPADADKSKEDTGLQFVTFTEVRFVWRDKSMVAVSRSENTTTDKANDEDKSKSPKVFSTINLDRRGSLLKSSG
jgi:hypothetical protein